MADDGVVVAIDQGTTGSRVVVVGHAGAVAGWAYEEFTQRYPRPGWVEHDAIEIWDSVQSLLRRALERAGAAPERVRAIGVTNQRETTVLWDRATGKPVGNAVVWQDRRTADACAELRARHAETVRRKTGLPIDPYFSATKIARMLDDRPGLRGRAEAGEIAFGTIDAWLLANLTGGAEHATDVSNASRTLLFDIDRLDWDDELLGIFGVPRATLPRVVDTSGPVGVTAPERFMGVEAPVSAMVGDQQSALFAQRCFRQGDMKCTFGTGSFVLMHTGAERAASEELLSTVAWRRAGSRAEYALEGAIFVTGAAVQWLRDGLGVIADASETEALARSVPDTGGVAFVPALAGLGAPYWDAEARGLLVGVTRGTTRAHLARAVLESIAYRVRDVVDAMRRDSGIEPASLRADGGASANAFLMQFLSDTLGVPILVPREAESTALGAAYLAGLGVGAWSSADELEDAWRLQRRYEPRSDDGERAAGYARWREAVDRCRGWAAV